MSSTSTPRAIQQTLESLGTPLPDVTFVVIDLETTGGRPEAEGITEVGAVKVRGGEVLGEFATLVDPGRAIPVTITHLTGITTAMVTGAPRIAEVMPSLLEFLGTGSVLVAHNARFDVGFLKAACAGLNINFPNLTVIDTVKLARAVVPRDEARNHKLGTLAALFGATVTPNHRALSDARATVDVLHALLERLGTLGVHTLEDLQGVSAQVPASRRRKSHLAHTLPNEPGVYIFRDDTGHPLYVGTSVNIQRRVKSYFTASEQRRRMGEMVNLAESVTPIPCSTALEAHVREVRLIAEHRPRYNRRSTRPEKVAWIKITDEPFPRLSVVRERTSTDATHIGPFRSLKAARAAREIIYEIRAIRQCTRRLPLTPKGPSCALEELGRCPAPCVGGINASDYRFMVKNVHDNLTTRSLPLVRDAESRLRHLAELERFEHARESRDGLLELLRGLDRHQRRAPLIANPEFIAARPRPSGGWEFACIKYGRLAGTAVAPRGTDTRPVIASLRATADAGPTIDQTYYPLTEETDILLAWLDSPGVRLVHSDKPWVMPTQSAAAPRRRLDDTIVKAQQAARAW